MGNLNDLIHRKRSPFPKGKARDRTEYFACYLIKCGKSNIF